MDASASWLRTKIYGREMNMKKTIKILAIAMVLVLSVLAFVACDFEIDFPFDGSNNNTGNGNGNNNGGNGGSTGNNGGGTGNNGGSDGDGTINRTGTYTLDVYSINDLHGKFTDSAEPNGQPGVDEMTTYLKQKAEAQNTVFLSTGDMWQGSCESGLTKGNIITDWMNDLGFASMTLGNHEFDWGIDPILDNIEIAEFPVLAINVYDYDTNQRLEGCEASAVVDKGDLKVGIIGAIGDCYSSISADRVEGEVYFKTDDDLTALVKAEATRLREEEKVDFVIYSLHDGCTSSSSKIREFKGNLYNEEGDYYDLSLSDGYIDLVFEAHTHQSYIVKDEHGVYHLQGGGDNKKGITHAEAVINFDTGEVTVTPEIVYHNTYTAQAGDPIVDELMEKYDSLVGTMNDSLGTNSMDRMSADLSNIVAKLYYEKGVEKWGSQYDIILGGGSINVRSPYNLYYGDITYSMLYMLFPFDNEIVLCSISGTNLKNRFITNGSYVTYGYNNQNIVTNSNIRYYIVTDTWNSSYKSNGLTIVDRYAEGVYARDLLAEYAKNKGFN